MNSLRYTPQNSVPSNYVLIISEVLRLVGVSCEPGVAGLILSIIAHLFEFSFLGIFLSAGMRERKCHYPNAIVLFCALLVAVSDEFIQGFTAGRISSINDVVIDFVGAAGGLCLHLLLRIKFRPGYYLPD